MLNNKPSERPEMEAVLLQVIWAQVQNEYQAVTERQAEAISNLKNESKELIQAFEKEKEILNNKFDSEKQKVQDELNSVKETLKDVSMNSNHKMKTKTLKFQTKTIK